MENEISSTLSNTDVATMNDIHLKTLKIHKLLRNEFGANSQLLSESVKVEIFELITLIDIVSRNNSNSIKSLAKMHPYNEIFSNADNSCIISDLIKLRFANIRHGVERRRFTPTLHLLKRIGDMSKVFGLMYQINEIKCLSKAIEVLSWSSESPDCLLKAKSLFQLLIHKREKQLTRRMSLIVQQEKHEIIRYLSCPNLQFCSENNDCEETPNIATSAVIKSVNEINRLLEEATPNPVTQLLTFAPCTELDNDADHAVEGEVSSSNTESERELNGLITKLIALAASQQNAMMEVSKAVKLCMNERNLSRMRIEIERTFLILNLQYSACVGELSQMHFSMEHPKAVRQYTIQDVRFYGLNNFGDEDEYSYWFVTVITCGTNVFVSKILSANENGCVECYDIFKWKHLKEFKKVSLELYSYKVKNNKFWLCKKFSQFLNECKWKKQINGDDHESMFALLATAEITNIEIPDKRLDYQTMEGFFFNTRSTIIPNVRGFGMITRSFKLIK